MLSSLKNKVKLAITGAAILVVIIGAIQFIDSIKNFESRTPFGLWKKSYYFYDEKFIPVLNSISNTVPNNMSIVISSLIHAQPTYFINHQLLVPPPKVTSKISLIYYMVKSNSSYLLVFENFSKQDALNPLFSTSGLNNLTTDFRKIGTYKTDTNLKFHLYTINKKWLS